MKNKFKVLVNSTKEKLLSADYKKFSSEITQNIQSWAAVLNQDTLLKWLDNIKFDTSDYDKAMDATYNSLKDGGGNHRLFDGGHSLHEAWDKVQEANSDDTFLVEVIGYFKALWNDASTVKGLPFQTLEQADYNEWVNKITDTIPGISKEWLYDLTSFDIFELLGTTVGCVSAVFMLNKEDKKRFNTILGTMGVSSIAGANPIMGIITVVLAGYAFFIKKHKLDKTAIGKSAALTAISSLLFAVLGLPFLIELVLVLVVTNLLKKKVIENDEILNVVKHHLTTNKDKALSFVITGLQKLINKLDNLDSTRTNKEAA